MMPDFERLSKHLEDLVGDFLGNKSLINPYFRISKATPEQTRKYFLLNSKVPRLIILVWILILIPLNILKFVLVLILSVIFFRQNSIFKKKIYKTQVIFLSHGTKNNLSNRQKDTYFDLLPNKIQSSKGFTSTILYTNQNWFGFRRNCKLLGQKNTELNHILIPKFLMTREHIKYFLVIINFAVRTLILGVEYYKKNPDISRILLCSTPWYFSRATYANFLLISRVKQILTKINISSMFLTFEGHSYEQLIVNELEFGSQGTKIFFYQHSPIVPFHYGIRSFLLRCKANITVLTTGIFYKEYFESLSKSPNYKVIGTNKNSFFASDMNINKTGKILYAPDGTTFATNEFVDLIRSIISKSAENMHVLRLHPDLKKSLRLRVKISRLKKYRNFSISSGELDSDLANSNYLVYRTSAVGIESLKYDLLPVYYSDSKFTGLNVLFSNDKAYCKAENSDAILTILKSHRNKLSETHRMALFNSYFSNINYKNFDDSIKSIS